MRLRLGLGTAIHLVAMPYSIVAFLMLVYSPYVQHAYDRLSTSLTAEYIDYVTAALYYGRGKDVTLDLHDYMHRINKKHMSMSFKRPEWFMRL